MTPPASARTLVALFLIWIVATAVNVTKAFHIDDTAYLEIARWIADHPLHPMSGQLFWSQAAEPIYHLNQPHLFFYAIAIWTTAFGSSEVAQHLLLALFTGGGILLFHGLSRAVIQRDSIAPTALLFLGPAFLPSQNVMVDVPLLFFWLLFFWGIFHAARSEHDIQGLVVAGVAASGAVLTKYSGIVLVPTLLFFVVRLRRGKAWWAVLIPLLTVVAWSGFNRWDYGYVHIVNRRIPSSPWTSARSRLPEWFVVLGGVAPLFPLSARPRMRTLKGWRGVCLAASLTFGVTAAIGYVRNGENEPPAVHATNVLLAFLFAANGVWVLLSAAAAVMRERGRGATIHAECLALWMFGAAAFVWLFAPFMAVRHVLLALPPIILALCLAADRAEQRGGVWLALGMSMGLGLVLSVSDWKLADAYRVQAQDIRGELGTSRHVWFTGHWGWQWYATTANMVLYEPGRSVLRPGDVLVEPALVDRQSVRPTDRSRLRILSQREVKASAWTLARTMSSSPFGGFYLNRGLGLPWKVSTRPLDVFTIWAVDDLP